METELNLDPDSNQDPNPELIMDPDPYLQIISDPAGFGCTTLREALVQIADRGSRDEEIITYTATWDDGMKQYCFFKRRYR